MRNGVIETELGKCQDEEIAKYQATITKEKLGRFNYWDMIMRVCRDGIIPRSHWFWRWRKCPLCNAKVEKGREGHILIYGCVQCKYRYAEDAPDSYY